MDGVVDVWVVLVVLATVDCEAVREFAGVERDTVGAATSSLVVISSDGSVKT